MKKSLKKVLAAVLSMVLLLGIWIIPADAAGSSKMLANVVIGYWENWVNSETPNIKLREVNPGWDVVIVSFMICDSSNYIGLFDVDNTLYPGSNREADFKADVEFCQARGQKVLISAGGATGKLSLNSEAQRDAYLESIIKIVDKFGFDGIDIDFENSILNVTASDTLNNPTTNIQNYLNYILHKLVDRYGKDFMVTMAPEHPYVQGGALSWGGYYGGYLPLINLTRDIITFIHPQYYNNPINGYDGSWGTEDLGFSGYNADSLIKLSEMLINGFKTFKGEMFEGLRPDQVAIGVPCSSTAAGSGYLPLSEYQSALADLMQKYPDFRGIMTWSINYDAADNQFVTKMNETIDKYKKPDSVSITSVTSSHSGTVKAGTDVTWTVETADADGTVYYTYELFCDGVPAAKNTSVSAVYTVKLSQPGTYTLKVTASDNVSSVDAEWTDVVTVLAPLSISAVTANADNTEFTVTTGGGEGAIRYSYYFLKDGKVIQSSAYSYKNQITFNIQKPGTYNLRVYAQDRSGKRVAKTVAFTCR